MSDKRAFLEAANTALYRCAQQGVSRMIGETVYDQARNLQVCTEIIADTFMELARADAEKGRKQ